MINDSESVFNSVPNDTSGIAQCLDFFFFFESVIINYK